MGDKERKALFFGETKKGFAWYIKLDVSYATIYILRSDDITTYDKI